MPNITNNSVTTTNINIRIDANIKQEAETLFEKLGISLSGAINIFFRQAIRLQAIPFEIKAKSPEDDYNDYFSPDVVKSILKSAEHIKRGESITFTIEELIAMEDGNIPQRAIDFMESHKKAVNED
ncbi:MAG: type II toxin-antitoxin system RelB/DinJ family antitoxin [Oscillospiraceae bacterium]|nr:type II toxin-antitoxin system RelB/DinJ family antitoxin [Oscillospiraceae bacterium]